MTNNLSVPEPSRATELARLELSRIAPDTSLDSVFRRACELSANALVVERVGVWLFIDNRGALRCANLFERTKGMHSAGALLRVADFPTYFESLTIRRAVPAEVAATEPWTAELAESYLQPLGIASMLDAGIFVDGAMVGVLCFEHVGAAREWTTEARDFSGSVADLLTLRIQSAEARELRAAFLTQRERLASQDKNAAVAQLAAGLAHDFRNLLTAVLGHGQMLRARHDMPADARAQANQIVEAAEHGNNLVKELLEFARPSRRSPAVIDLGTTATQFLPVLQAAVGSLFELACSLPRGLGQVLIDKSQFTRLLLNLVVNASEAMPDGGRIDIRLAPVRLTGNPSYSGRFVLLEVSDHGVGIDEATLKRVFDPFFTTKSKGTGLGLAIVREIVEQAGGLIRVESTVGRGTTVRAFFPRIGTSSGGTSEYAILPEPGLGQANVP